MSLTLFIGNKAYSSWSLRPWLLMRALDIPFREEVVPLYVEGSREKMLREAPTGKVPVLRDGDVAVWDSLAIVEYLAEGFPDKNIWPRDRQKRARARSLCAEMHSGFQALRQACPTNFRRARRAAPLPLDEGARADLARIQTIFARSEGRIPVRRFLRRRRLFRAGRHPPRRLRARTGRRPRGPIATAFWPCPRSGNGARARKPRAGSSKSGKTFDPPPGRPRTTCAHRRPRVPDPRPRSVVLDRRLPQQHERVLAGVFRRISRSIS